MSVFNSKVEVHYFRCLDPYFDGQRFHKSHKHSQEIIFAIFKKQMSLLLSTTINCEKYA